MGHARLKHLNETGAKLLILVPGAGLEPARTLPGPWDFKSANYLPYHSLTDTKTLYQWEFPAGMASCCLLQRDSSVTGLVTVWLQEHRRFI